MEGLAKSAPVEEVKEKEAPIKSQPNREVSSTMMWEGCPIDFFRYFSVDLGLVPPSEIAKLRDIYEWGKSKCSEPTVGNVLEKISSLEHQLGAPNINQSQYDKIWNFIRLQKQIDDLEKRKQAMAKDKIGIMKENKWL